MGQGLQAKPPTPQGISALLRKAGFGRATDTKRHRLGVVDHTSGYRVKVSRGDVVVNWWPDTTRPDAYSPARIDGDAATAQEMHERYAEAIRVAGWAAEVTRLNVRVYALPVPSDEG